MSDNKEELFEQTTIDALNNINKIKKSDEGVVERVNKTSMLQNSIGDYFINLLGNKSDASRVLSKILKKIEALVDEIDDWQELNKAASLFLQYESKKDESITSLFKSSGPDKSMIDLLERKNGDEDDVSTAFDKIDSSKDLKKIDSLIRNINNIASQEAQVKDVTEEN